MSDLFEQMLADIDAGVKQKNEWLEHKLKDTRANLIEDAAVGYTRHAKLDDELRQVSNAFTKMEERVKLSNLTDHFPSLPLETIQSKTERSLAQSLSRYARLHSAIQIVC